jgi:hypothetical protein
VLGGGDVAPKCFEAGVEGIGRRAEQFVEASVDEATRSLAGVRVVGIVTGGAGVLDLRDGAVYAKGLVERAGDDRLESPAFRA